MKAQTPSAFQFRGHGIFLLDAIGAFISVVLLSLVYLFQQHFGMPQRVLGMFIGIALLFCVYSTVVYLTKPVRWSVYLRIIALLNLSYCAFTLYHVMAHSAVLTGLGYAYFAAEILVILALSVYELNYASRASRG